MEKRLGLALITAEQNVGQHFFAGYCSNFHSFCSFQFFCRGLGWVLPVDTTTEEKSLKAADKR